MTATRLFFISNEYKNKQQDHYIDFSETKFIRTISEFLVVTNNNSIIEDDILDRRYP
jgi:hypothetical protein